MGSVATVEVMNIGSMLNQKIGQHHFPGHFFDHQPTNYSLIKTEPMERSVSPHGSEHSQYSGSHMARSYHSPSAMHAPMAMSQPMHNQMSLPSFPDMPNMNGMQSMPQQQMQQQQPQQAQPSAKSYPCSTCGKQFARRSDLARHERIHSGVRPHVCDYPGCGKMFIQRSALTVHQRVHTGEKPHHCEICAKRFSDSSSLARHRRTHLGQRPYKCPYADCQKTFTRRTTLNRHQNHHSGTIEEAAAATAAALAATRSKAASQARSEGDHMSSHSSPMSTPSPGQRTMSMSPSIDLAGGNGMGRHGGDVQYMQNGGLPAHLRVGSPVSTSSGGFNPGLRPTSHPTSYGPPSTLEPNLEQHQQGPTSAGGSPHMSNVGWQSPTHMASPSSQNSGSYAYPDPAHYPPNQAMNQMYYSAVPGGRPQSAEPGLVHMA